MTDRAQEEIMHSWRNKGDCIVSVVCATYNHENYIEQAIKSFLSQKTSFPFEIIIHDDASTDGTQDIIKKYQKKYPELIHPIFQTENQYSKGNFKPLFYAAGYARGQYIALCEGDDFWIDNEKLQIQIDCMLENPDVDFSFHSAWIARGDACKKKIMVP